MIRRPRFKPHLHVEVVPGEGVFLLSEREQLVLQGRLYELVASCLDGAPAEELCARLRGRASPAEVYYTLGRLEQKGCLMDGDAPVPPGEAALWTIQSIDPAEAAKRLAETPVAVRVVGDVDGGPFRELLRSLPRPTVRKGRGFPARTDRRSHRRLSEKWFGRVQPGGAGVGPAVAAGQAGRVPASGSARCSFPARPAAGAAWPTASGPTRRWPATWKKRRAATANPAWTCAALRPHCRSASAWPRTPWRPGSPAADCRCWKGKSRRWTSLLGRARRTSWSGSRRARRAASRPRSTGRPSRWCCKARRKACTQDGATAASRRSRRWSATAGTSARSPGRCRCWSGTARPATASSTSTCPATTRPGGRATLRGLRSDLRSSNAGKGATDVQAKAGALCEALERYSGVFRGDEARRTARLADLGDAGDRPATPVMLFSDKQYRERDAWNARGSRWDIVPAPFDPDGRDGVDAGLVADARRGALAADRLLLFRLSAGPRHGGLLELLQRQRGRQHAGRGHFAGLPGAGRARRRRPVVVQPRPPAGRRSRQLR